MRTKLLNMKLKSCKECPYCDYIDKLWMCAHAQGEGEIDKDREPFPDWCPLQEEKK